MVISQDQVKRIALGLTEKDATRELEEAGYQVRVVCEDGEQLAVTAEYIPNRANLSLQDGKVANLFIG